MLLLSKNETWYYSILCTLAILAQVLYIDGDQEVLNLKKEKWEYIEGDFGSDEVGNWHSIC